MDDLPLGLLVFAVFVTVHVLGSYYNLYRRSPNFDIITHFLGGLSLSIFIKNITFALFLFIVWELIEVTLVKRGSPAFRETLANKLRDLLVGMAGFVLGLYLIG